MKTSIYISGQIGGNHTLRNAIGGCQVEVKKRMFFATEILFATKKEAVNALAGAYQDLRKDSNWPVVRYVRGNFLAYDASKALITPTNEL